MVEQAKYEVLKKIGKIEIRRYPSLVIAKVDEYGDGGFNFLFRFIPSDNRQKLDIAMTAPVVRARLFVHNFISKKLEMEFFSEF